MPDKEFIKNLIQSVISGKYAALHAYDKMIWVVRSGFLTLVFAGWSLLIKSAVEVKAAYHQIATYVFILAAFSIALAIGGYLIDRNYARRKFRVIRCVNQMMRMILTLEYEHLETSELTELADLLKICGDAANDNWRSKEYYNEIFVSRVIYSVPSALIAGIIFYYILNL